MGYLNRFQARLKSIFTPHTALKLAGIVIVIVLAAAGAVVVSTYSLPGNPYYALKLAVESARLTFAPNLQIRAELEDEFDERRLQEAQAVTLAHLSASLDFGGTLDKVSGSQWQIDGIQVDVPAAATIIGQPETGLYVHITGSSQADGVVQADLVEVEGVIFQGRLSAIEGMNWQVDFKTVYLNGNTQINGSPALGDVVEVTAKVLSDGSFMAESIRVVAREQSMEPAPEQAPERRGRTD